jgi:hypothetical protein
MGFAASAIVSTQIKARLFWFDAGQFGARRPKFIDELVVREFCHG